MIRYYRLFDLLNRRGMKKTDLLEVISAPTLAKLSKGKNIQTDNIDKICLFLDCQPSDIMEVINESQVIDDTLMISSKHEILPDSNGEDSYTEEFAETKPEQYSIQQSDEMNTTHRFYFE